MRRKVGGLGCLGKRPFRCATRALEVCLLSALLLNTVYADRERASADTSTLPKVEDEARYGASRALINHGGDLAAYTDDLAPLRRLIPLPKFRPDASRRQGTSENASSAAEPAGREQKQDTVRPGEENAAIIAQGKSEKDNSEEGSGEESKGLEVKEGGVDGRGFFGANAAEWFENGSPDGKVHVTQSRKGPSLNDILRGERVVLGTVMDLNRDRLSDLVFLDAAPYSPETGVKIIVACQGDLVFVECHRTWAKIPAELAQALDGFEPFSVAALDLLHNGVWNLVLLFRKKVTRPNRRFFAPKSAVEESVFKLAVFKATPLPPIGGRADRAMRFEHFDFSFVSLVDDELKVPPIFVDVDFDGAVDFLSGIASSPERGEGAGDSDSGASESDQRVVYKNNGQNTFIRTLWQDAGNAFDQRTYAKSPKFNFDTDLHLSLPNGSGLGAAKPRFSQSSQGADSDQSSGRVSGSDDDGRIGQSKTRIGGAVENSEGGGVQKWPSGWLKGVWEETWGRGRGQSTNGASAKPQGFEDRYLSAHSKQFEQWQPRPLPIASPAALARIQKSVIVDLNGDCLPDLVLVIESPDFPNRHELEVWITERRGGGAGGEGTGDSTVPLIRRQWKNQRLLLPEGTLAIEVNHFGVGGAADLVVVACDPAASFFRHFDWDGTRHTDGFLPGGCAGGERLYFFRGFQTPPRPTAPVPTERGQGNRQGNRQGNSTSSQKSSQSETLSGSVSGSGRIPGLESGAALCDARGFAFGGFEAAFPKTGVSVSSIYYESEVERVSLAQAVDPFPISIKSVDLDNNGYRDALLFVSTPKGSEVRLFKNVPHKDDESARETERQALHGVVEAFSNSQGSNSQASAALATLLLLKNGLYSIVEGLLDALLGRAKFPSSNFYPRRLVPWKSIVSPGGTFYAAGFLQDFNTRSITNLFAFAANDDLDTHASLYTHADGSFGAVDLTSTNYFVSVQLLNPTTCTASSPNAPLPTLTSTLSSTDNQLSNTVNGGAAQHAEVTESFRERPKQTLLSRNESPLPTPAFGAALAVMTTDLTGAKVVLRQSQQAAEWMGHVSPSTQIIGLGQSSNYLDYLAVSYPPAFRMPADCQDQQLPQPDESRDSGSKASTGNDSLGPTPSHTTSAVPAPTAATFIREWPALLPNSRVEVATSPEIWKTDKWTLTLLVRPAQEAGKIFLFAVSSLAIVALIHSWLKASEKSRQQRRYHHMPRPYR